MKFGCDLDGVLFDTESQYIKVINFMLGTNYNIEDIKQYDIAESLSLDKDFVDHVIGSVIGSGRYDIYEHVLSNLRSIAMLVSDPIYFITSRKPVWINQTRDKLYELCGGIPCLGDFKIIHTNHDRYGTETQEKWEIINELGLDFFVEDSGERALDIGRHTSCRSILMDRPWNRWVNDERVYRVFGWKSITTIVWEECIQEPWDYLYDARHDNE